MPLPGDKTLHAVGHHSGVMHRRDGQADNRAAKQAAEAKHSTAREQKADRRAEHGDEERHNGQHRIEANRNASVITEHRHEMRAPDRHAGRERGQEIPAQALIAAGVGRPLEEPACHPRASHAEQRCEGDKPGIMLVDDATQHRHHGTRPFTLQRSEPDWPDVTLRLIFRGIRPPRAGIPSAPALPTGSSGKARHARSCS